MGKPKAPKPPDPRETSAAQTGTSVATALANTNLGNVSRVGPTGSLKYDTTGSFKFEDPYTGMSYDIPTFTATESLTPAQQRIFNQTQAAEYGLASSANKGASRLDKTLGQRFTLDGLPEAGEAPVGGPLIENYSKDRRRVEKALLKRAAPMQARDKAALEASLADQGITLGSRAYSAAQDDFGRNINDFRLAATGAAGEEQARLRGMDLAKQGQQFNQDLATFGAKNTLREQGLNERFAERSQPINEIIALLSGSQVQMPNFGVNQPTPIPTTDNAGLINENYRQKAANYQQEMAAKQSLWGGLFGLGAAGITGAGAAGGIGNLFRR